MASAGSTNSPEPFSWISLEGRTVIREIVEAAVPQWTAPRDTQLDCWAHILQGIPTILIASTGWGKTSAFFIPILVLKHLQKHPNPRVPKLPSSPVALVVTPLIELGNAHALEISQFGLTAVSLSAESLETAKSEGRDLLQEVRQLASDEIDAIIRDEKFRANLILLGIDEVHILVPWGKDFHQAYHQTTILRKCLPDSTALICPGVKAIVYCRTIDLGFRVALYGWRSYPPECRRLENVRLWTSVTSAKYNTRTLELFTDNNNTSGIVASVAFGMGMNLRNVTDVVNVGLPSSYSGLIQQNGHPGRNLSMEARAWTYIEPSIISAIKDDIENNDSDSDSDELPVKTKTTVRKATGLDALDSGLRKMGRAFIRGFCLIANSNVISGNPGPKSRLTCEQAGRRFPCSNCEPFLPPTVESTPSSTSNDPPSTSNNEPSATTATVKPITKKYQANVLLWLENFATERWNAKMDVSAHLFPPLTLWTGISAQTIAENFHLFNSQESLGSCLAQWEYLDSDGGALFDLVVKLKQNFEKHAQQQKDIRNRKAAATRARKKEGSSCRFNNLSRY
ncbi:ATP-dependent DNA helicase RecQ [Flammula alnicola]|nr:ATP-dependent DNA helicase RecQ [Flammula alnicola]